MAQADRQPDKATWWSVTAFNDEILLCEDIAKYPSFVKKVYGGREKCPTTGTPHFQGAIQCFTQQRMSSIKNWLPTANLQIAKQKDALIKYAMKEDTATGEKLERCNPAKFYTADELLEEIAYKILGLEDDEKYRGDEGVKNLFNQAIYSMLMENKKLAGQLMNPSLRNFWCATYRVWINHAKVRKQGEEGRFFRHEIDREESRRRLAAFHSEEGRRRRSGRFRAG